MTQPMTDARLDWIAKVGGCDFCDPSLIECTNEIRRLREELASRDMHADLNRRTAEALGKPSEGVGSSWHDIPECVRRLREENERARELLVEWQKAYTAYLDLDRTDDLMFEEPSDKTGTFLDGVKP